jgi:catechol 2,3-dioxygenase-like lactoylglutathione lyase family enzyme
MIDHTGVIVSDIAKSKAFYSAALGAMGIALMKEFPAAVTGVSTSPVMERRKSRPRV